MTRGFGPPALAAMGVSALGASIFFIFGVVSKHALGLTPVVFLFSALFFVSQTGREEFCAIGYRDRSFLLTIVAHEAEVYL